MEAIDALTNQVGAADVGPTSVCGWTAAWLDLRPGEHPLDFLPPPYLAIEDVAIGDTCANGIARSLTVHTKFTAPKHLRWHRPVIGSVGDHPHLTAKPHELADQLYVLFGPADDAPDQRVDLDIKRAVATELARDQHIRDLIDHLADLLNLPPSSPEHPPITALSVRTKPALARAAAALCGPARILPGKDQTKWTTMAPHNPAVPGAELAPSLAADPDGSRLLAVATKTIRNRDIVVALWRSGPACGWELWQRGVQIAGGTWNTGWRDLYVAENSEATYRVLCSTLTTPRDCAEAYDLLCSRDRVFDPLPDFIEQFGLPSELLLALDRPATFRQCAELVTASSPAVGSAPSLGLGDLVSAAPQAESAASGSNRAPGADGLMASPTALAPTSVSGRTSSGGSGGPAGSGGPGGSDDRRSSGGSGGLADRTTSAGSAGSMALGTPTAPTTPTAPGAPTGHTTTLATATSATPAAPATLIATAGQTAPPRPTSAPNTTIGQSAADSADQTTTLDQITTLDQTTAPDQATTLDQATSSDATTALDQACSPDATTTADQTTASDLTTAPEPDGQPGRTVAVPPTGGRWVRLGATIPLRAAGIFSTIVLSVLLVATVASLVLGYVDDGSASAFEYGAVLVTALFTIADAIVTHRFRVRDAAGRQPPITAQSAS